MKTVIAAALAAFMAAPAFAAPQAADIPPEVKAAIKERCVKKWTRGEADDFSMIAFCIDREVEAWAKVEGFK